MISSYRVPALVSRRQRFGYDRRKAAALSGGFLYGLI